MKKLILLLLLTFYACETRMSTEELTQEIKQNMIEYFAENDDVADIKLVDLKLVHKGGNEYKGIADVIIENPVADLLNDWSEQDILKKNIEVTYSVEVIYDGEMFSWEIQE
jgi:hypothetical protein